MPQDMRTRLGREKRFQILWKGAVARTLREGFSVKMLREDCGCNIGCFLTDCHLLSFVNMISHFNSCCVCVLFSDTT